MKTEVFADADSVAQADASFIAAKARAAFAARGRFILALSGGCTPRPMLRVLSREDVPWDFLHVVQVDERIAQLGHPDRHLTRSRESLLQDAPLRDEQIHLVTGDPVLDVTDSDVAMTGVYQGKRRMTLTYPILNRSRRILWIVTWREKAEMLARLRAGELSIPTGRVNRKQTLVLADRTAAGQRTRLRSRRCRHDPRRNRCGSEWIRFETRTARATPRGRP